MSNHSVFPNSARTAWLLRDRRRPRPARITQEDREQRLLAKELARGLREATLQQLVEVARVLGYPAKWLELARMEAHHPGVVGRICLRAAR